MSMDDSISRQVAIRWVKTECNPYGKPTLDFESGKKVIEHLKQMPPAQPEVTEEAVKEYCRKRSLCIVDSALLKKYASAQPERKRGKWITNNPNNPYESDYCKCSVCGYTNCTVEVLAFDGYNFCPNCGTDMRGEQNG